ncbi:MAG: hypothetical protein WC755_02265 [Candidatus Woesearchaeota archaeon]|jgi:hypothetical protein
MQKELLKKLFHMYASLDAQYYDILVKEKPSGRIVHDLNSGRTPLVSNMELLEDSINNNEKITEHKLSNYLAVYERAEEKLFKIYKTLGHTKTYIKTKHIIKNQS